jgi:RHS repeat-associated protein
MAGQRGWVRARGRAVSTALAALILSLLVIAGLPAGASAAECTNNWIGSAEGLWKWAPNWSAGHVPTTSDVACIPAGKRPQVTELAAQAAVVQGEGGILISSSSLEITSTTVASTIATLTLKGTGALTGAGTLYITSELNWPEGSEMSGTGTTVISPGAKANLSAAVSLKRRHLINEGTFTESSGPITLYEGAEIANKGSYVIEGRIDAGTGSGLVVNTGTFTKTGSALKEVRAPFENHGTVSVQGGQLGFAANASSDKAASWEAAGGAEVVFMKGTFTLSGSTLKGSIRCSASSVPGNLGNATVNAEGIEGKAADIAQDGSSTLNLLGAAMTVNSYRSKGNSVLAGSANLHITGSFNWEEEGQMKGTGEVFIAPGATGSVTGALRLKYGRLVNEGSFTVSHYLGESEGAQILNKGTFTINEWVGQDAGVTTFVNSGTLRKTGGPATVRLGPFFENFGVIKPESGQIEIVRPLSLPASVRLGHNCNGGDPVECATGNFAETQTDFAIGGRGVGLALARSYSAQAAATATAPGAFGYGWTNSFGDSLTSEESGKKEKLTQADGGAVTFTQSGSAWVPPAWSQYSLSGSPASGYTLTLPDQTKYAFSGAGRLLSVTDRNGNATTLSYDEAGRLKAISDPAGRQITLAYNGEGLVESATDPMGHVVKYAYEGKNLVKVTEPGETEPRWQFKYDASHRITTMTNGRGGKTTNEYDSSSRVVSQVDPAERKTTFEYAPFHTKVTNKATGAVTDEWFTSNNQPFSVTNGYGTAAATTRTFTYDEAGHMLAATDGAGHTTTYGYDAAGNRTSEKDPLGHETKWSFNATHDVVSTTTPGGETTTIERDGKGNVESVSRPAPGKTTQTIALAHDEHGQLESVTDPLGHTWSYGYDAYGDPTSETDPLGNEQTLGYDEDSRLVSVTSPRGNLEGAEPAQYTTTVERDAQGRPLKVTDPLGGATKYAYDGNGNLASVTDAKEQTTKYTYNADDERTKVEKPSGATLQTGYDGAGAVTSQTNGNGKTTTYVRNVLEQPVEVIDPLARKTTEAFDAAGNLASTVDPAERKTTYSYDAAGRLTRADYSEEATPDASFEYDADGNVTAFSDGTGESSFAYDQLGRLTRSEDGHGAVVEYAYDLGERQTGFLYPNGKEVSRAYDTAGRLESITDWLGGTTTFGYDADSNLTGIAFPAASGDVDEYAYDRASRMSEARFKKGGETLASLSYLRDALGQVEEEARSGLPGPEAIGYGYDKDDRLIEAGTASFEYDPADNLTKGIGSTNAYDAASQLETGTGLTYAYDKLGERTKSTPSSGPATTYAYDQAGNLTSISRPEEGEVAGIAESFAYDATGLLASKTSGLTTRHFTWGLSGSLPLLLNDGERSYVYGPGGLPIEQINSSEAPTYLHHDQLGSTRLLTGANGETSASFSYAPYGGLEGNTGTATTPLGFAGQYTDGESGLQYLRARFYDQGTGQFLTRDPIEGQTRQPYSYGVDNPLNGVDPSGLDGELVAGGCIAGEVVDPLGGCGPGAAAGAVGEGIKWGAGVATATILSGILGDDDESSSEDETPCLEPPVDPLSRGKQIGDGRQGRDFAQELSDKLLSTAGGGPPGGSRERAIFAIILLLIHAARGSG